MVELSVTLSDPEHQFQGHSNSLKAIISQTVHAVAKCISALCVHDAQCTILISEDNITSFSNDTNVARSLSNS